MNFYKYQGTGNDFILIDNRAETFDKHNFQLIAALCDRHFGIGADGLILLENQLGYDFKMVYFNADGNESTMCGNGGRCLVAFAKKLKMISENAFFSAIDGVHHAKIDAHSVALQMTNVAEIKTEPSYIFLDTGSPHHVQLVDDLQNIDVKQLGSAIRYSNLYAKHGSNVNFVQQLSADAFAIRTYERGVEDETLSCGTGATAVAIAMHAAGKTQSKVVQIKVQGGELKISFDEHHRAYSNIFLEGPTQLVFEGTLSLV